MSEHTGKTLSKDCLEIDAAAESERIARWIRDRVRSFNKKGAVVALSGGIDSSVVAALSVRALDKSRVCALLMPEKESSHETLPLSRLVVDFLGVESVEKDITEILEAVECYRERDRAIRSVVPEYTDGWKCKIVLPSLWDNDAYRLFSVVVASPTGETQKKRLTQEAYLGILSASNFKQRVRKMLEYYHADRLNYVVVGTPNRLEYDQGFFVKLGDGAADLKPIAHLYKTQVYQLADYLDLPQEIRERPPTTDTYSLAQSQEEFYFSVPYKTFDYCLYGKDKGMAPEEVAELVDLSPLQVERVYEDIEAKRKSARYLHAPPFLLDDTLKGEEWLRGTL
jgi:NAD+ synthase